MTSTEPSDTEPKELGMPPEPVKKETGGYTKLAEGMGACQTTAIFRRFSTLSVENLLYLQGDIICLEKRLRRIQTEDRESVHRDRSRYFNDWFLIRDAERLSKVEGDGNSPSQLRTILQIRKQLKEYCE